MTFADTPLQMLLRRLELIVDLPEEDRQAVLALPHRTRTVEASTYLTREGDVPTVCGVLGTGFAYRQKLTGDGVRQIVALHIPGDALDMQHLFLDMADHSVQMLTRGEVAFIPRKDLQELINARPLVRQAVLSSILVEGSIFREWVLNVGRRDARTRLAHLLCEFASRMEAQGLSDGEGFELPITQEQLADAVGLTPVHVNRTLKSLEADGLITRNKRNIVFPSWERMRDVGDFNPRYLHLDRQLSAQVG
ncbi:CRP-like cAMP-binding protein [Brevundimonas alba]|uniref:CRP-like cAMP-binding protein n=1 Tax=Brevundimonas alba TaxID=74314 RepID=A0A7X5YI41_9CAUL|nr:Crp/Fnr family transcriptional regulator [Brevundimonas alba]NJC40362.1 CRP-like cAMP-binding protein [Brevundimonas alba]